MGTSYHNKAICRSRFETGTRFAGSVLFPGAWRLCRRQAKRGGKRGERGAKKFSTQWKAVSGVFPHNGNMFRKIFHTMEAGFGHFSTQWKRVFHAVENFIRDRIAEGQGRARLRPRRQRRIKRFPWGILPVGRAVPASRFPAALVPPARRGRLAPPSRRSVSRRKRRRGRGPCFRQWSARAGNR
jgi:hypothetical protein